MTTPDPPDSPASPEDLHAARDAIRTARAIVVLTGSGVSAESEIPTFREAEQAARDAAQDPADGRNSGTMKALWAEFDPQTLATPEAFDRDPEMVTRWYDWRRLKCLDAQPNPGHLALATIQQEAEARGARFTLLTQNVDGLHQRAGSRGVVELHGSIMAWRCVRTGTPATLPEGPFVEFPPRHPETGHPLRPSVVWFGEMLPERAVAAASDALGACDLFLSIGTSSVVYPAAGFIHAAREAGATTIEVNPDATPISGVIDLALRGKSGEVLPELT
jgi:NAD-dependent deacetylase